MTTFRHRLREACEDAILWGVKVSIALAVFVAFFGWLGLNYLDTRTKANAAVQWIQQVQAAQQQAAKQAPK